MHFGSCWQGCCLQITQSLPESSCRQAKGWGKRKKKERDQGLKEGANAYFSWLILDCLQGFCHTWELPTLAKIKRDQRYPALSRTTAGSNKPNTQAFLMHTCEALSQPATVFPQLGVKKTKTRMTSSKCFNSNLGRWRSCIKQHSNILRSTVYMKR